MPSFLRRRVVVIFITSLVVITIFEFLYLLQQNERPLLAEEEKNVENSTPMGKGNAEELRFWVQRIGKVGGEQAFQELLKTYTALTPIEQHTHAHIFGTALYQKMGLDGVAVCDNSFDFGCYHSFLGTAIQDQGLNVVPMLDARCKEKLQSQALGCQHGIGHGVQAFLGYSFSNIVEALRVCQKLPASDPIGGCFGGVFMEYDFQTMIGKEGTTRTLDQENYYELCTSLDQLFRPACYYWQAQWWNAVLQGSVEERYQKINALCAYLPDRDMTRDCYQGAGNTLGASVQWDIERAKEICSHMMNSESVYFCSLGAAGSFYAEPTTRPAALRLCEGLGIHEQECKETTSRGS